MSDYFADVTYPAMETDSIDLPRYVSVYPQRLRIHNDGDGIMFVRFECDLFPIVRVEPRWTLVPFREGVDIFVRIRSQSASVRKMLLEKRTATVKMYAYARVGTFLGGNNRPGSRMSLFSGSCSVQLQFDEEEGEAAAVAAEQQPPSGGDDNAEAGRGQMTLHLEPYSARNSVSQSPEADISYLFREENGADQAAEGNNLFADELHGSSTSSEWSSGDEPFAFAFAFDEEEGDQEKAETEDDQPIDRPVRL